MDHRKHTENNIPTLIIGEPQAVFAHNIFTLADIVPCIARVLFD